MALIKCPQCGEEISDRGKICPHCHFVLQGEPQYQQPAKPGNSFLIPLTIAGAITIGLFLLTRWMYPYSGWLLFGILCGFSAIVSIGIVISQIKSIEEYNLSQTDPAAYQKLREEQQQKYIETVSENQRREEERLSKLPPCPICGSKEHVKRLSSANRAVSVTAWGAASAKIGKQYECTCCKHYF